MMAWTTAVDMGPLYSWSVRPDLWGPGVWARAGDPHQDRTLANWSPDIWEAQLEMSRARGSGIGDPGAAEALVLAGQVRVWSMGGAYRWTTWWPADPRI